MWSAFHRVVGLVLVATTGFLFLSLGSDDAFISQLIDRLRAYNEQRPTEKVYLHTDRETYLTGETIWMKGYLFNGTNHVADTVSNPTQCLPVRTNSGLTLILCAMSRRPISSAKH